jgi:hypothetical protein
VNAILSVPLFFALEGRLVTMKFRYAYEPLGVERGCIEI